MNENEILDPDQKDKLNEFLLKHKDIFSTSDTDIGQCNKAKHRIDLINETPFELRYRRIPPNMIDEVRQRLEQLCGIIRPSKSPYGVLLF